MARRNRVTPFGEIVVTPARGTQMGNRGCLHDETGRILRHHRGQRWIVCELAFRGRRRPILQPGLYTELFFLDEATALAAGHRPCAECMRERFDAYRFAWAAGNPALAAGTLPSAPGIDAVLHRERLDAGGGKRTYVASLETLPDGCMVRLPGSEAAYLVRVAALYPWSPEGYGAPVARGEGAVEVITPRSAVRAFGAGYRPRVHGGA
jgi:hypothetical protein